MCSYSYPIPILSLFIPSLYPFLFSSLLPFFTACTVSRCIYNNNGGLAPKIGLSTWTKLDGYSYEQALSRYVQVYIFSHCNVFC